MVGQFIVSIRQRAQLWDYTGEICTIAAAAIVSNVSVIDVFRSRTSLEPQQFKWDEDRVNQELDRMMFKGVHAVHGVADEYDIDSWPHR